MYLPKPPTSNLKLKLTFIIKMSGGGTSDEVHVVVFVALCLLVGGVFRTINQKFKFVYTPLLLIFGMAASHLGSIQEDLDQGFQVFKGINKHGLLTIFVPIVIFEPALNIKWHYFAEIWGQVSILSLPVMLITAGLSTVVFQYLVGISSGISWYGAWILGILVSITDPVEVIAKLNQKRASHKFITMIELEALTNDATGIMFFNFFSALALVDHPPSLNFKFFMMNTVVAALGGIALGWIFRYIC